MDALAAGFLEQLRAGRVDPERLAVSGEPEPGRAIDAFERAAAHPDLAGNLELWVPELLVGARPGYGAERLLEVVTRRSGRLDPGGLCSLARVLAASNFLGRALASHPEWASELRGTPPGPPAGGPPPPDWTCIRTAKYLGLLRVAARDLWGRPFEESLKELSDLADGCLKAALGCAVAETGEEAPGLLALGKLGGRELNFSSDVDLLVIYRAADAQEDRARNPAAATLARRLKRGLEEPTAEGFGYRVDFDLRPEGPPGALANSVSAALDYYETFGAEWERQMLIRLRGVAGDEQASRAFADAIVPFVYRRAVGPEALAHVRAMKTRIEEERHLQRVDLDAHLKEGPGGIRDVEFLVQALQLFYGGAHPELRTGNVLEALEALRSLDILPEGTASVLSSKYLWLRRAEHALQLEEERQVHTMPRDPAAQRALARRMGYRDTEAERARQRMLDDWTAARTEVRGTFEELVLGDAPVSRASPSPFEGVLSSPLLCRRLATSGAEFLEHQGADALPRSAALRRGLAAVLASEPGAAGFVTRRSAMASRWSQLDGEWLARRALELERAGEGDAGLDLESFLDELRLLRREDTVLAACLDLSGSVPFVEVSAFLSSLAEGIVGRALRVAEAHCSHEKRAPLAVVAMGKLAGREFTYHSDLDLIFLTPGEADGVEPASRLAQRLVGYLSTMTGAGIAYPVDARLRPSGHQGMLVTTFAGFERYQLERAQPWEHLALMRSRVIAGAVVEGQALLDRTRAAILARGLSPWRSVAELRDRVHAERGREGLTGIAFKTGIGGIMDVEFLACGALLERGAVGAPFPPSIPAMLRVIAKGAATEALLERYAFLRELEARVRWVTDRPETSLDPRSESFEVVAALMTPEEPAVRLLERLESARREVAAAADRVLAVGSIRGLGG